MKANRIKLGCLAVVSLIGVFPFIYRGEASQGKPLPGGFSKILDVNPRLTARAVKTYPLTGLDPKKTCSLSVSLRLAEAMSASDGEEVLRKHRANLRRVTT